MPTKRVLVTGATGFMGNRLCEVLWLSGVMTPKAVIHSTGNAARIARYPMEFVIGDLCDADCVRGAMEGCDAVVHLARGGGGVMRKGLENVLQAAIEQQVSRFVHMSSVAVHGNAPPPESASEDAPARHTELAYGNQKLDQERRVLRYLRKHHLPAVILRPPNVYGPYSAFTVGLVQKIRDGRMAIVGEGTNPCNLVYIDNLIEAIILALWKPEAVGQIFFIVDNEPVTWSQCLGDYGKILGISIPHVRVSDLIQPKRNRLFRDSLRTLPRAVVSPEFRHALRKVPLIEKVEMSLYNSFRSLSPETRASIRRHLGGPQHHLQVATQDGFDGNDNIIAAQARTVAHSNLKARRLLGYTAPVSYQEGFALTREWLHFSRLA